MEPRFAFDGRTVRLGPWLELTANRFATIERGATEPRIWTPQD